MVFQHIIVEAKGSAGWLTINRPAQLGALNLELLREIEEGVGRLAAEREIAVIAITGSGERAFVSGADIAAMRGMGPADAETFASQGHRTMRVIEECAKPVIAAVNGFALGGGLELALACDIIYAVDTAKFGLPEVKLGIYPGFGGTQRLPRIVGAARARELIFTGRVVGAAEAERWGLVNRVLSPAELKPEVEKLAQEIGANGPLAIAAAKRLIHEGRDLSLTAALEKERASFPGIFKSEDRLEGLSAFLEKRKAVFRGK